MPNRENAKPCVIREQIIEGDTCGLTIQFELIDSNVNGKPETRMRLFGESLPCGNREFIFDHHGNEAAAGTHTSGHCKPIWSGERGGTVDDSAQSGGGG